jgi:hypothetical protein
VSAHSDLRTTVERSYQLVGRPLTAYLAGAHNVAELDLATAKTDHDVATGAASRLQFLVRVAAEFRAKNAVVLLRPWLREVDDELGSAPATVIRSTVDPADLERLRSHARAYLRAA